MNLDRLLSPPAIGRLLDIARGTSEQEFLAAIRSDDPRPERLARLLAPIGERHLDLLGRASSAATVRQFGRTIQFYVPLYVSNECTNGCLYCGFSNDNRFVRTSLTIDEAFEEVRCLTGFGFRNILIVAGESPAEVPAAYLEELARRAVRLSPSLSIEVGPLGEDEYRRLAAAGIDGITVYQETYHPETYAAVHPSGPKRDYAWRLETPERAGRAGLRRIGIGALLGLYDWRYEALCLGLHARQLMRIAWRSFVSVSFPRIRGNARGYAAPRPVSDGELAQMACALRLYLPECGLVLSTREPAALRDRLLPLGFTQASAGSRTRPGGYALGTASGEQFEIEDTRTPDEMEAAVRRLGYDPVWKDWEETLHG